MVEDYSLLTTLRVESRCCALLSFHLDRFAAGSKALNFAFDRGGLERFLKKVAAEYQQQSPASLRVTVARDGSWKIEPPQPLTHRVGPLVASLWPDPVTSGDPLLPFSTTHRPIYEGSLRRARKLGFLDYVFQNEHGFVTEGADHNIFVRHGKRWRTPTLGAGVLPGVYRRHLLDTMENVFEENFKKDRLFDADEIWFTNAVYGIHRVSQVDGSD